MIQSDPRSANCDQTCQTIQGIAVAFPNINIDTDAIFPKQFLKTIKRTGLEDALFADWRFDQNGHPVRSFILNRPGFENPKILIAGDNFGCGSSREHAVWALKDFGIEALISSSYGSIFHNNCVKNLIWPLTVSSHDLGVLLNCVASDKPRTLKLNLQNLAIFPGSGTKVKASIADSDYNKLCSGLEEIDQTLQLKESIDLFEKKHLLRFPWLS